LSLKPRYRGYFVAATFAIGLIAAGFYNRMLSETVGFASFQACSSFLPLPPFSIASIGWSSWRTDRVKRWTVVFLLSFLWLHLISSGLRRFPEAGGRLLLLVGKADGSLADHCLQGSVAALQA
jgi:hypothetical protein